MPTSLMGWLVWLGSVWAVFFAFAASDVPDLLGRAANLLRQQNLPHWARHGHAPAPDEPAPHGRHVRKAGAQ